MSRYIYVVPIVLFSLLILFSLYKPTKDLDIKRGPKKIVFGVDTNCVKCKTEVLKAVTKLGGIDKLEVDSEKKTLTVVGDVDPAEVVKKLRRAGKSAEIISVGPPKEQQEQLPTCSKPCELVVASHACYERQACSPLQSSSCYIIK